MHHVESSSQQYWQQAVTYTRRQDTIHRNNTNIKTNGQNNISNNNINMDYAPVKRIHQIYPISRRRINNGRYNRQSHRKQCFELSTTAGDGFTSAQSQITWTSADALYPNQVNSKNYINTLTSSGGLHQTSVFFIFSCFSIFPFRPIFSPISHRPDLNAIHSKLHIWQKTLAVRRLLNICYGWIESASWKWDGSYPQPADNSSISFKI